MFSYRPAFWTLDDEFHESRAGEIDIFESVNAVTQGQYTLHTDDGCNQANTTGMTYDDSTLVSTNCYYKANGNQGCGYTDDRDGSAGQPFAQNGGGVHAMLYDGQGIRVSAISMGAISYALTCTVASL